MQQSKKSKRKKLVWKQKKIVYKNIKIALCIQNDYFIYTLWARNGEKNGDKS
jgi:hypothetical protein